MKNALFTLLFICFSCIDLFAQCPDEPVLDRSAILATSRIPLDSSAEITFTLVASSFQTSWELKGSESAAVSIFVDGKYNQDVLLFSGTKAILTDDAKGFEYNVFLGKLDKGNHTVDVMLNRKRSASRIGPIDITDMRIGWITPGDYRKIPQDEQGRKLNQSQRRTRFIALANAPFIYARPNAVDKFTDIPLVMYHEIFNEPGDITRIRYTMIFTNEDGGTQSKALMARWGRMTDIEWVYEISFDKKGAVVAETYQGANHQTKDFKGKRVFGSHPLIYTVTDNNNFSDTGCSALRFALEPQETDLSNGSRETVMDRFPWTYGVMADEMFREGRVAANSKEPNIVDDPREYIYAEIYDEPQSAAVALEVLTNDGTAFSSDLGFGPLRIDRPGYFRVALHLPPDVAENTIRAYSIRCYSVGGSQNGVCKNVRLVKIVKLNENYLPVENVLSFPAQTVKSGEAATFPLK